MIGIIDKNDRCGFGMVEDAFLMNPNYNCTNSLATGQFSIVFVYDELSNIQLNLLFKFHISISIYFSWP